MYSQTFKIQVKFWENLNKKLSKFERFQDYSENNSDKKLSSWRLSNRRLSRSLERNMKHGYSKISNKLYSREKIWMKHQENIKWGFLSEEDGILYKKSTRDFNKKSANFN